MDLAALTALYPIVRDLLNRSPQIQKWVEKKARREDPIFLMQLQLLEGMSDLKSELRSGIGDLKSELRSGIGDLKSGIDDLKSGIGDLKSELRSGISDLRGYILTTAIMSAMLSNPALTGEQIREKFIKSVEVSEDILKTIKQITP